MLASPRFTSTQGLRAASVLRQLTNGNPDRMRRFRNTTQLTISAITCAVYVDVIVVIAGSGGVVAADGPHLTERALAAQHKREHHWHGLFYGVFSSNFFCCVGFLGGETVEPTLKWFWPIFIYGHLISI